MKKLNEYLVTRKQEKPNYKYSPQNRTELMKVLNYKFISSGNGCDLNDIDVSKITDMHDLFLVYPHFNGKLDKWNVGNVENMSNMFKFCQDFQGDISGWDVSKVRDMSGMFSFSSFNQNIEDWNVSNVRNMDSMFDGSEFNGKISGWDVSNVRSMKFMFQYSDFNQSIRNWDVSDVEDMRYMFNHAEKFRQDLSPWNPVHLVKYDMIFYKSGLKKKEYPEWYIKLKDRDDKMKQPLPF